MHLGTKICPEASNEVPSFKDLPMKSTWLAKVCDHLQERAMEDEMGRTCQIKRLCPSTYIPKPLV